MNDEVSVLEQKKDRRAILALFAGGAAAAVASALGRAETARADHGAFSAASNDGAPGIHGDNSSDGAGVEGTGNDGPGVRGQSQGYFGGEFEGPQGISAFGTSPGFYSAAGVFTSTHGFGAACGSEQGVGLAANGRVTGIVGERSAPASESANAAVVGVSEVRINNPETPQSDVGSGVGVRGISATGAGVEGVSLPEGTAVHIGDISFQFPVWEPISGPLGTGTGVHGRSGTGIGVHAEALDNAGLALKVDGRAQFSTAGAGTIPAGSDSGFVASQLVTTASHISVTLVADPGGRHLAWVDRSPGVGFTVHLTPGGGGDEVPFTYLIVETGNGGGGGFELVIGDVDCDGDVDGNDALGIMRHAAGLSPLPGNEGCPPIGAAV